MKENEILKLKSLKSAAIVAPAGHGKTEMIVDLVKNISGKLLLLTHTNAGVDVLQKRLNQKKIEKHQYVINTIAGFCMKWCDAFPATAEIDSSITRSDKQYYSMYYSGTKKIFTHNWARDILSRTYSAVIVDEYQDCIIDQHNILLEINKAISVYVLGDPLQAIFGWAGELVSWQNLQFPIVEAETLPWRWKKSNVALGKYLSDIRKCLMPALYGAQITLELETVANCTEVISCSNRLSPEFLRSLRVYNSVLYITKWPREQRDVCIYTGGLFQNDEPQAIEDLYEFARCIDSKNGLIMSNAVYDLMAKCATHVNEELKTYKIHLAKGNSDFTRIQKHPVFGAQIKKVFEYAEKKYVISSLNYFKECPNFNIYRKELFYEAIRALNYSIANNISVEIAAQQIRLLPENIKRYSNFQFLSSRTVLSKGLEFDCVVIDLSQYQNKAYNVCDFYVAMTRAMRKIYYITDKKNLILNI